MARTKHEHLLEGIENGIRLYIIQHDETHEFERVSRCTVKKAAEAAAEVLLSTPFEEGQDCILHPKPSVATVTPLMEAERAISKLLDAKHPDRTPIHVDGCPEHVAALEAVEKERIEEAEEREGVLE